MTSSPAARPQWMTPEQYAGFPDELTVRETRVDHQVLVTTLIDHRQVNKADLSALYAQRWNVELGIGNSNAIGRPKNGLKKAPGRARRGLKYASQGVCRLGAAELEGL